MEDLVNYLKNEISLDAFIGCTLSQLWEYAKDYYIHKKDSVLESLIESKTSLPALDSIKELNQDSVYQINWKKSLWPTILKIPDIYITQNSKVIHDNRNDKASTTHKLSNTYNFNDLDEKSVIIKSSTQSIFFSFFDGFNTNLIFLNSSKNTEIRVEREFFVRSQANLLNVEKKNLLNKDNFNDEIKDLKSSRLSTSSKNTKDPNNVEELVFLSRIKSLVIDALLNAPNNIMLAEDLIEMIGLEPGINWQRSFFNRQIRYLENNGQIENLKARVPRTDNRMPSSSKAKLDISKRCIRLIDPNLLSGSIDSNNSKTNNLLTFDTESQNPSFPDNFSESQSFDQNNYDYNNYIDPDNQYMFSVLKNCNRGLLYILPPDVQIAYLVFMSGKNGIKTKSITYLFNHLSHKYISRTMSKKFIECKNTKPLVKFIYENIGRESSKRYFATDELIKNHKLLFPPSLISTPRLDSSLSNYNIFNQTSPEKSNSIKDSVFYIPPSQPDDSENTDLASLVPTANSINPISSSRKDKDVWEVFSYSYLLKSINSGCRISIVKLIREQTVIDILETQKIIEITQSFMGFLEMTIPQYQSKLILGLVDTDIKFPNSSEESSPSKLFDPKTRFDFDLNLLAKSASNLTHKSYKICKKTLNKTFLELESYGYGKCRFFFIDSEAINSNSFKPRYFPNEIYDKDQIINKAIFDKKRNENLITRTILIHSSIDPESEIVENYIKSSKSPHAQNYTFKSLKKNSFLPNSFTIERPKNHNNNITFKDIRSQSASKKKLLNSQDSLVPKVSLSNDKRGVKRLFSSYLEDKDSEKSMSGSDNQLPKKKPNHLDLDSVNQSNIDPFTDNYDQFNPENNDNSPSYSLNIQNVIATNDEKISSYHDLTVEFMYRPSRMALTKEIHEFLIKKIFQTGKTSTKAFSYGRFGVSQVLQSFPLSFIFKLVKWKKVTGVLHEYLDGKFDSFINKSRQSSPGIGNSENGQDKRSNILNLSDRLETPLGSLPISILKIVLNDAYKIRRAIRPIIGVLIRLELLRPLKKAELIDCDEIPESILSSAYDQNEQFDFLISKNSDPSYFKGSKSSEKLKENDHKKDTTNVKSIFNISWENLFELYPGYQLMSTVAIRDYRDPFILPPYIENRVYSLLEKSNLDRFWIDIKSMSLNPKFVLKDLPSNPLTEDKRFLHPFENIGKRYNSDPLSSRINLNIIPISKDPRDPLFNINQEHQWNVNINKLSFSQKTVLNSYIDFVNKVTPINDEKILEVISKQNYLEVSAAKSYYQKYELEWLSRKRNLNLSSIKDVDMVNLRKKRKVLNSGSSSLSFKPKKNSAELKKMIRGINLKEKIVLNKFIDSFKLHNDIEKYRKRYGNFSVYEPYADIVDTHYYFEFENNLKMFDYLKSKDFKEFRKKDFLKYPASYILYHAYLSSKHHDIGKYMDIYRSYKNEIVVNYITEMAKVNDGCIPRKTNGFDYIFNVYKNKHSKNFNYFKNFYSNSLKSTSSPINNNTSLNSGVETPISYKYLSDYLINYEMCIKLGHMLTKIFSRRARRNANNIFNVRRDHFLNKWSTLDSNRLLVSVSILNWLNKSHSLPLHWNLVQLSFKYDISFYNTSRLKFIFSRLMKKPKNTEYFNRIELIYSKIRPHISKTGFLLNLDDIFQTYTTYGSTNRISFQHFNTLNNKSPFDKEIFDNSNNYNKEKSQNSENEDLNSNNTNSELEIIQKIDLFKETNFTVGLIFYFGIPFLMDALGLSHDSIEINNSGLSINSGPDILSNDIKSTQSSSNIHLPGSIDLLFNKYVINTSSDSMVISKTELQGRSLLSRNIVNSSKDDFISDTELIISDDEFNHLTDFKSRNFFQNSFYEDYVNDQASLKKHMSESYLFMQNLRMSWLSTLNYPTDHSVIHKIDTIKIKKNFKNMPYTLKILAINRLQLFWASLGGYLDYHQDKDAYVFGNENSNLYTNFSTYKAAFKDVDYLENFESIQLAPYSLYSASNSYERLRGIYPLKQNCYQLFYYFMETFENFNTFCKNYIKELECTIDFINSNRDEEINVNENTTRNLEVVSFDTEVKDNPQHINMDSLFLKNLTLPYKVDSYFRRNILQQIIFKIILTSDNIYNSEYFYNLILHNSGRKFFLHIENTDESKASVDSFDDYSSSSFDNADFDSFYIPFNNNIVVKVVDRTTTPCSDDKELIKQSQKETESNLLIFTMVLKFFNKIGILTKSRRSDNLAKNDSDTRYIAGINEMTFDQMDIMGNTNATNSLEISDERGSIDPVEISNSEESNIDTREKLQNDVFVLIDDKKLDFNSENDLNFSNSLENGTLSKRSKVSSNFTGDQTKKFTIRSICLTERYVNNLKPKFASEFFLQQATYAIPKLELAFKNMNFGKNFKNNQTTIHNKNPLKHFNSSNKNLLSGSLSDLSTSHDLKNYNLNESSIDFINAKNTSLITLSKETSSGEFAYLVEYASQRKISFDVPFNNQISFISRYSGFWRNLFSSQSKNEVYASPIYSNCEIKRNESENTTIVKNSSNFLSINSPTTKKISQNLFFSLVKFVSRAIFESGPLGYTLLDIKLCVLMRYHPPLLLPNDKHIRLAVDYLDLNNLLDDREKYSKMIQESLEIFLEPSENEYKLDTERIKYIYRVGARETRYTSVTYVSFWSIGVPNGKSFISKEEALSSTNSVANNDTVNKNTADFKISRLLYTTRNDTIDVEDKILPNPSNIGDSNIDDEDKMGNTQTGEYYKTIPGKIWYGIDGKLNKNFTKAILESVISIISSHPGVYESHISRKLGLNISNSELSEVLDYLLLYRIIYKKSIIPCKKYLELTTIQNSVFNPNSRQKVPNNNFLNSDSFLQTSLSEMPSNHNMSKVKTPSLKIESPLTGNRSYKKKPGSVLFSKTPSFKLVENESIQLNLIYCYWTSPKYLELFLKLNM
ncbi:hypothetical protein AYI69_g1214 [Smittium culicis]|uniref:Uncharacterized protein n=1 Tax=Smittium culicis TaxID=133412 RepID=A0A1R1YQV9_9FUNG|nr:hypothetical protein AYI69_g1214 [Smittium culicis]